MVTGETIRSAARSLGLSNRIICIHSSLRSFGPVWDGADTIIDALLAEGCTVLVPTFSWDFAVPPPPDQRPVRNGWDYERFAGSNSGINRIFRPDSNEIDRHDMGLLPTAVVERPDRVRGNHPLCSFSAVGWAANQLIDGQTLLDVFAPLKALVALDGFVILMGVNLNRMTLLHLAEELAGRTLFRRWANDANGKAAMVAVGGCSEGFNRLSPGLVRLARTVLVGQSGWQVYSAQQVIMTAVEAIKINPNCTTCASPDCDRCHDAVQGGPILNTL
jgi:aminoglycoside 3-N-acetyltransferase